MKHFWIGEFCPRRETVLQVPLDCSDCTRKISYNFWARPFNLIWSRAVIKDHSIPTPEEIRSAIALRYVRGQRLAISEGFWCTLQLTDNCKNWYVSATGYTGMKQTASPSARRDSHPEGEGVKDGAMIWPTLGRDSVPLFKSKFKKMIMKFICNPFFLIDLVVFEVFALIMCLFMFKL